jgi:hypothetical protein
MPMLMLIGMCGCSAGGTSHVSVPTTVLPGPTSPTGGAAPTTSARFTITVPVAEGMSSSSRKAAYVSPSTLSVVITLVSVNGSAYTGTPASVATNVACTTPPSCVYTVTAPAVPGSDVFTVATYDAAQMSTAPTAPTGSLLSEAMTMVTVTAGTANVVTTPLVLGGVVNSVAISVGPTTLPAGTAATVPVTVAAFDANHNQIVGMANYISAADTALAITLANSDSSGLTALSTTSVTSPATAVALTYTGGLPQTATLSATITGSVNNTTLPGGITPSSVAITIPTPTLTALSAAEWVTGSAATSFTETLAGTNFVTGATVTAGPGISVSNVSVTNPTSLTVTFTVAANAPPGSPTVSVANGPVASGTLPLSLVPGRAVTLATDTAAVDGTGVVGNGAGAAGDLRYAIKTAIAGDTIVFDCGSTTPTCNITLAGPLPPITANLTIDGGSYGNVIVDGNGSFRVFFVDSGTVSLKNLEIAHALAQGGGGGSSVLGAVDGGAGGGGLGAGAGLFVNNVTAQVTLVNDFFLDCTAVGGAGGVPSNAGTEAFGGGGGGGLDAPGGTANAANNSEGAGGGGGVLSAGGAGMFFSGAGGGGAGFGGAAGPNTGFGGAGGAAYTSNDSAGTAGQCASSCNGGGGNGGFGGGGGGGTLNNGPLSGGNGGLGGGGGGGAYSPFAFGSGLGGAAGAGGGGGGGGSGSTGGPGGGIAALSGGTGAATGAGGGGAAAGPAVFVVNGSLTVSDSGASGATATGGTAGGASATAGTANATPVFNFGGTVNGSSTTGPVAGALGTTTPASAARQVAPTATTSSGPWRR